MFSAKKVTIGLASTFAAVGIGSQFIYTVQPSDMANVRRLGNMRYEGPVGEGPHFRIPLIDQVDPIQVKLRTLHIPPFIVNTIDNQRVTLDINFTYLLPLGQVNRMLYDTGKTDDGDIDDNSDSIIPVAMDRAARVFARQNTVDISANREKIQAEVTAAVFADVRELFGLEPKSLQIGPLGYSRTFVDSNEDAAAAKNEAVAEENKQDSVTAIANQDVIVAKGVADASIKSADGRAKAIEMNADAALTTRLLQAQGEEARLRSEIKPFGNPAAYIEYLEKQAELNWNGKRSQVEIVGGEKAAGTPPATVVVPVPGMRP